jgi:NAD(P)-dependent dehydrogenase (short-subunit alcohol dehydrogenase family)
MDVSSAWNESPAPELRLPDLEGKIAVVTGTSLGLGKATAEQLLNNGTRVFGLARRASNIAHPLFTPLAVDLTDTNGIEEAFQAITRLTPKLDYVVNVAGDDPKHLIDEIAVEQWDRLVDLNLRAYYFIIKYAMPLLRCGNGKSIVNVSSINYRLGIPGRAPYSATKAGILGLTTGLSRELGREGIRVNTVAPGWVFTERQIEEYFSGAEAEKHLRFLEEKQAVKIKITSRDIANHILFYLSQVSRASVAHNCVVDGGWILE